jgi:hypothetical protein
MLIKRAHRNQEDASPGGGAPAPAEPTAPQGAQPVALPSNIVDAIRSVVSESFAAAVPDLRNGIFADLRKAGALKKEPAQPAPPNPAPQPTGAPTQAAGLSVSDVDAMLERERVITSRATRHELSDAQVRRMRAALAGVDQDKLVTEADSFLTDLGLTKTQNQATTQQAQAPAIPVAPVQPPISDKGSPAPGGVLDWEREFSENPIGMSAAARQRMDAKYGAEKARRMRVEAAQRQAELIKVTRPQG